MSNINQRFLNFIDSKTKYEILGNIANHYQISEVEALEELVDDEAEHFLEYLTEPVRSAANVIYKRNYSRI